MGLSCDGTSEPTTDGVLLGENTDAWLSMEGVFASLVEGLRWPGGSGAGRNRLPIPLTTTPGCIPKNGVSKLMVPNM